jgi:hypothetical protein
MCAVHTHVRQCYADVSTQSNQPTDCTLPLSWLYARLALRSTNPVPVRQPVPRPNLRKRSHAEAQATHPRMHSPQTPADHEPPHNLKLCTYNYDRGANLVNATALCTPPPVHGKYGIPGGAVCDGARNLAECPRPWE